MAGYTKKSLLIGINYTGSDHALQGCQGDVWNMADFLSHRGYRREDQVILTDTQENYNSRFFPTGANMLAAMDWLVRSPNSICFLQYSGHGGQVPDEEGDRPSGFDDTICPVDFEEHGQMKSQILHQHLVSALHPTSSLFVVFDCCHSGSAIELPYVYRTDGEGNVSVMNNLEAGMHLAGEASSLLAGGFTFDKIGRAMELYGGAKDFFRGFQHMGGHEEAGLAAEEFGDDWSQERKMVTMFSGCRDDQTSADATIGGAHVGAMSWAFLQVMHGYDNMSYIEALQATRDLLVQSNYTQVPQLSVGLENMDLNQPMYI